MATSSVAACRLVRKRSNKQGESRLALPEASRPDRRDAGQSHDPRVRTLYAQEPTEPFSPSTPKPGATESIKSNSAALGNHCSPAAEIGV